MSDDLLRDHAAQTLVVVVAVVVVVVVLLFIGEGEGGDDPNDDTQNSVLGVSWLEL